MRFISISVTEIPIPLKPKRLIVDEYLTTVVTFIGFSRHHVRSGDF